MKVSKISKKYQMIKLMTFHSLEHSITKVKNHNICTFVQTFNILAFNKQLYVYIENEDVYNVPSIYHRT